MMDDSKYKKAEPLSHEDFSTMTRGQTCHEIQEENPDNTHCVRSSQVCDSGA